MSKCIFGILSLGRILCSFSSTCFALALAFACTLACYPVAAKWVCVFDLFHSHLIHFCLYGWNVWNRIRTGNIDKFKRIHFSFEHRMRLMFFRLASIGNWFVNREFFLFFFCLSRLSFGSFKLKMEVNVCFFGLCSYVVFLVAVSVFFFILSSVLLVFVCVAGTYRT